MNLQHVTLQISLGGKCQCTLRAFNSVSMFCQDVLVVHMFRKEGGITLGTLVSLYCLMDRLLVASQIFDCLESLVAFITRNLKQTKVQDFPFYHHVGKCTSGVTSSHGIYISTHQKPVLNLGVVQNSVRGFQSFRQKHFSDPIHPHPNPFNEPTKPVH